jgi:hypothetical protein
MNISNIKVMLDVNTPGNTSVPITYDLFYLPKPEEKQKSEEPTSKKRGASHSTYPFFTMDVKYPQDAIKALGREKGIEFFFDEKKFKSLLGDVAISHNDMKKHENANHNVMVMLEILFPTKLPIQDNIHESFREMIEQVQTPVETSSIVPTFISDLLFENDEDEFSYLNIGGSKYTVIKITWINDIINHPEYRKLIDSGNAAWEWWNGKDKSSEGEKKNIEKTNAEDMNKMISIWNKMIEKADSSEYSKIIDDISVDHRVSNFKILKGMADKIKENIKRLFGNGTIDNSNVDDFMKIIYDIDEYDNGYIVASGKSSLIPFSLNKEYSYEKVQSFALKIRTRKELIEFCNNPHKYNKLFKSNKSDKKSAEEKKDAQLREEIEKRKEFKGFLESAASFLKKRKSSNPYLYNMIYYYLNSNGIKKYKSKLDEIKLLNEDEINLSTFMHKMNEIYLDENIKQSTPNPYPLQILDTGVDMLKVEVSDKKDENPEKSDKTETAKFEIYVQIDVVKGILDKKSMENVKCAFRNSFAVKMHDSLVNKDLNKAVLDKDRFYLDIDVLIKEESEKASKKKEEEKKTSEKKEETGNKSGGRRSRKRILSLRRLRKSKKVTTKNF